MPVDSFQLMASIKKISKDKFYRVKTRDEILNIRGSHSLLTDYSVFKSENT